MQMIGNLGSERSAHAICEALSTVSWLKHGLMLTPHLDTLATTTGRCPDQLPEAHRQRIGDRSRSRAYVPGHGDVTDVRARLLSVEVDRVPA